MGGVGCTGCVRAVEPRFDQSPKWMKNDGLSAGGFEEASVDKFLRDGHEQGPMEAMLERWAFGSGFQERGARPSGGLPVLKSSPVLLHIYDTMVPASGASSAENIHCGVEVHGREWSFSDLEACPGELTGIFVSAPRSCMGWKYDSSLSLGSTMASQDEMLRIVSIMKKEWPASSFGVDSRSSYHFCRDLCCSLDVGQIPDWVADMATGKKSVGSMLASTFLCCADKQPTVIAALESVPVLS
uniref:PPPDE domain-containing protein n=1 Tax=Alexandrium catenella TaxID=2925 RepID=A0A7S1LYY7_ALECA|mmetsp:Transcript_16717/g.45367  ORF Transcript_16717/g.45367 Transcript_16717/m.45367 type:complete len:242 (+) Transcript_16717:70-795(+)